MGTHNIIPATPQMAPHSERDKITTKGLRIIHMHAYQEFKKCFKAKLKLEGTVTYI